MKDSLVKERWKNYGRWKQPVISGTFWTYWHEAKSAQEIAKGEPLPAIVFLDGYTITREDEDLSVKDYFTKMYDTNSLGEFQERLDRCSKKAEDRHLALLKKDSLSDTEYLTELFESYLGVIGFWSYLFRFVSPLEELTRERGLASTDDEMLAKMRPYIRTTWLEEQSLDVKSLTRQLLVIHPNIRPEELTTEMLKNHPNLLIAAKVHLERFAWFGTHHWEGDGYTLEKLVVDMQEVLRKGVMNEKERPATLQGIGPDEVIWKTLASASYWRTHGAEVTAKIVFASRDRLQAVARRWGLSYGELTYLSSREILEALKNDPESIRLPDNYSERRSGYGCYLENGKEHIITGSELTECIEAAIPPADTSVSELRGVVASKGDVIVGTAKIILEPSDFPRFKDGDILVANETTPDFVPLMKKALAIVTDTGGITSHAAIVSRELKKPCVIGTKFGTRVIKDGATIEVDATAGIVRILKSHEH